MLVNFSCTGVQNNFVLVKFSCTGVYFGPNNTSSDPIENIRGPILAAVYLFFFSDQAIHAPHARCLSLNRRREIRYCTFRSFRIPEIRVRNVGATLGVLSIAPRRVCTLHHCTGCRHALSVVNALLKGAWSAEAAAYFQRLQNLCGATVPSRRNYSIGDFENELRILMIISF